MAQHPSIPPEVETFLHELLEGGSDNASGFYWFAETIEKMISKAEAQVTNPQTPETIKSVLRSTPRPLSPYPSMRKFFKKRIQQISRLGNPEYMENVYSILSDEFTQPRQWQAFIVAALRADYDFEQHRRNTEKAKKLSQDIAKSARKLAQQLEQFKSLYMDKIPPEFVNTHYLLAATHIFGIEGENDEKWNELRSTILGDVKYDDRLPSKQNHLPDTFSVWDLFTDDYERLFRPLYDIDSKFDESQSPIEYAWSMAPEPSALLGTLASAAYNYKPQQIGMVGTAIRSRKRNRKFEYIRAFGHALVDYGIELNNGAELNNLLIEAITITTNVILNDADLEATEDDVQYALSSSS